MAKVGETELDLMPPAFADGLDDWSGGDGTPDAPTYERALNARIARNDADFGTCLELRKIEPVQRLRYMGEVPILLGRFLEVTVRVKAVRGPLPWARIAAWPGSCHGRQVPGLCEIAATAALTRLNRVHTLRAVVGPTELSGVDLVWDPRAVFAHVGLDLFGADFGVVRIDRVAVRDVTSRFAAVASWNLDAVVLPPAE